MAEDLVVKELRVRTVRIPIRDPLETGGGSFASWPVVLLDLYTSAGIVGHAYLGCFRPFALAPLAQILHGFDESLTGMAVQPRSLGRRLKAEARLVGVQGFVASAIALVEIAAWDVVAKAANMPLAALLGAAPTPLPVYKTITSMDPAKARHMAADAIDAGYGGVKLKLGASAAKDLDLVRGVREVVGESFPIMGDYNQALTVPEAIERIRRLDEERLTWIEEPTAADDIDGHVSIASQVRTPLQLGESWTSVREAARNARAGTSVYVMPDLVRIGGVSAWLEAATLAGVSGTPISAHAFIEVSAHLLPTCGNAHWLEHVGLVDPILADVVAPSDGCYTATDRPGLGIEWNEAAIARFAVS